MTEKLNAIPNAFYDLIVFLTPTLLLGAGIVFGFRTAIHTGQTFHDVSTLGVIAIVVGVIVFSYEYGRAVEAWSATLIQRLLFFLQDKISRWPASDFSWAPDANVLDLGVTLSPEAARNRWTFYFQAFSIVPAIGSDLLKRYAWEKLARSNACTYLLLATGSVVGRALDGLGLAHMPSGTVGFGSWVYTAAMATMCIVTTSEYYRRNMWNMDLLEKVAPVLRAASIRAQAGGVAYTTSSPAPQQPSASPTTGGAP